ncbi:MAG: DUF1328 domain-containing protein [Chloroflexi bacterium]|nr:DUF1328 domain-containing protein [Chloroflexota bacterium]
MLSAALVFFLLAVLAGLIGFEVIASAFAGVAQIAFFLFLVLAVISLIANFARGAENAI